jgi:hypothetical protein
MAGIVGAGMTLSAAQSAPPPTQGPPTQQGQQQTAPPPLPVPRPFPGAPVPPSAAKAGAPQHATTQTPGTAQPPGSCSAAVPTEATLGVRMPPTVAYLESFDAGRGQCFHLYGTNDPFATVVDYFRGVLRGGRQVFREPPIQQFELGDFDDRTMAFPPAVVVKDYSWNGSEGYPFVKGATETRYKTIIQVVPPGPGR